MATRTFLPILVCATSLLADTVVLRSGKTITGEFLGGTARSVRIALDDRVETVSVSDIERIEFGQNESAAAVPAPPPPPRAEVLRPERPIEPQAAPATTAAVTVPEGTPVVIRMIDDIDSQRDNVGKTYRASLDEPVMSGTETVIPRGADVVVKLVDDKESGKLTGRTELTLDIVTVHVSGRDLEVDTTAVTQASESRTGRTAKVVGGTAALGAIIGAIAGGGKGAAVGAASGAAVGGAAQVLTKGQVVRIPSETRLSFNLAQPLKI